MSIEFSNCSFLNLLQADHFDLLKSQVAERQPTFSRHKKMLNEGMLFILAVKQTKVPND